MSLNLQQFFDFGTISSNLLSEATFSTYFKAQLYKGSIRVCYVGGLGAGKTMVAVRRAEQYFLLYPERPIYSNIQLNNVPYQPIRCIEDLFDILLKDQPCFVLLDEFWTTNDSSDKSIVQSVISVIMAMSRKAGWEVHFTEQWHTQLQLRTRFITDVWCEPCYSNKTEIVTARFFTKYGESLGGYMFDATPFYGSYETHAPPYTVDLRELQQKLTDFLNKQNKQRSNCAYIFHAT